MPVGIGHDRLPADLVKGNVLRRMPRGAGDRHRREDTFRIARRPVQHLHGAHGAAGDREQLVDPQMVDQQALRAHHVGDRDDREVQPVRLAGGGVGLLGPDRAQAAAQHVGADDEIAVGVERLARPHHQVPPSRLAGDRVGFGDELVARQRMADEDGVRSVCIQRAVCLVGEREGAELGSAVQAQLLFDAQFDTVAGQGDGGFRHAE